MTAAEKHKIVADRDRLLHGRTMPERRAENEHPTT